MLAGIHFSLPNFTQTIDFIHPEKSVSRGWTPRVSRVFNATGTLKATAYLGLPLGVSVGIDILDGKYSLQAGLVDTPSVDLTASYTASYSNDNGAITASSGSDTCNGIDWYIDVENRVDLVIPKHT